MHALGRSGDAQRLKDVYGRCCSMLRSEIHATQAPSAETELIWRSYLELALSKAPAPARPGPSSWGPRRVQARDAHRMAVLYVRAFEPVAAGRRPAGTRPWVGLGPVAPAPVGAVTARQLLSWRGHGWTSDERSALVLVGPRPSSARLAGALVRPRGPRACPCRGNAVLAAHAQLGCACRWRPTAGGHGGAPARRGAG